MRVIELVWLVGLVLLVGSLRSAFGASCVELRQLQLPATTITASEKISAGDFTPPEVRGRREPPRYDLLPDFCRVSATIKPSSDSEIRIEVWMPVSGWNGKLLSAGNGGWAGQISYPDLTQAVAKGYAGAATDTGHTNRGGAFALGHPEKLTDYAWRSVHELAVQAKAIIAAYYGIGPKRAYFQSCSTGGRQGLKEAQRFPGDYDGIIAGAPANYLSRLSVGQLWPGMATLGDSASYVPPEKYPVIHEAALEACDRMDGLRDGLIQNPMQCDFDPKSIQCSGQDGPGCLTGPQVAAVRKIYAGPRNPSTNSAIFPGFEPGSELGWSRVAGGPNGFPLATDYFRYVVFRNEDWDWKTLDFDKDVALAEDLDDGLIDAVDPNLEEFVARGGKLLLYHGWNDPVIPPRNTVNYFNSVAAATGDNAVPESVRLFMAPGVAHCRGGEGPSNFDMLTALDRWLEQGNAPDRIIATSPDRSRPLCSFPQVARYAGSGDPNQAASFACAPPE